MSDENQRWHCEKRGRSQLELLQVDSCRATEQGFTSGELLKTLNHVRCSENRNSSPENQLDPTERPGQRGGNQLANKNQFQHSHYLNYPMMIVRLSTVDVADLRELLGDAWKHAAS